MQKINILLFLILLPFFFTLSASSPHSPWNFCIANNVHPDIPNGSLLAIFRSSLPVKILRKNSTPPIFYIIDPNKKLIETISVDYAIMTGTNDQQLKVTPLSKPYYYFNMHQFSDPKRPHDIIFVFSQKQRPT